MTIQITVYWLKLPLKWPYQLSFGVLREYDSIIVMLGEEKNIYWGEATALPGYSWETAEGIWNVVLGCIDRSAKTLNSIRLEAHNCVQKNPFAATAILTAIEKYRSVIGDDSFEKSLQIPLVGILKGENGKSLTYSAENLISQGYRTLKLKLIGEPDADIWRVKEVQVALYGTNIRLRLDVNQGYDYEKAERFLCSIPLDSIELFEQPFPGKAWDWSSKLAAWCPVPLMLDESIWSVKDIESAASAGARIVKLKLMKHGSITNTFRLIEKAKSLNLGIVLGNGVQTHFGCVDECLIYKKAGLALPGEMNEFLKMKDVLLDGIFFKGGSAIVEKSYFPDEMKSMETPMPGIHKSYKTKLKG